MKGGGKGGLEGWVERGGNSKQSKGNEWPIVSKGGVNADRPTGRHSGHPPPSHRCYSPLHLTAPTAHGTDRLVYSVRMAKAASHMGWYSSVET